MPKKVAMQILSLHTLQDSWSSLPEDVAPWVRLRLLRSTGRIRCSLELGVVKGGLFVGLSGSKKWGKHGKNPASSWKKYTKCCNYTSRSTSIICLCYAFKFPKAKSAIIMFFIFCHELSWIIHPFSPAHLWQTCNLRWVYSLQAAPIAKSTCPPRK